jgi:hypothetical protein
MIISRFILGFPLAGGDQTGAGGNPAGVLLLGVLLLGDFVVPLGFALLALQPTLVGLGSDPL